MTPDSIEASSLDPETLMLVRIAAVSLARSPRSSAPRVASASGKIVEALAIEIEIAELEEESTAQ